MPLLHVLLGPPRDQFRVGLLLTLHLPINLRGQIIEPTFLLPLLGVGIKRGVLIKPLPARRVFRPPNPKRTNAPQPPWLKLLPLIVHPLDKMVDVFPPPI